LRIEIENELRASSLSSVDPYNFKEQNIRNLYAKT